MAKYRVRGEVTVDAIQWTGDNRDEVQALISQQIVFVEKGTWLVKDGHGHVGVVDAATFAKVYEPA